MANKRPRLIAAAIFSLLSWRFTPAPDAVSVPADLSANEPKLDTLQAVELAESVEIRMRMAGPMPRVAFMMTAFRSVFAGWLLVGSAGYVTGAGAPPPFSPSGELVRTHVEFIEVPLERFNALMFSQTGPVDDGEIRRQAGELLDRGEAREVEAMTAVASPGRAANVGSGREVSIPRDFWCPCMPRVESGGRLVGDRARNAVFAIGPAPEGWDRRRIGGSLEVHDPHVSEDGESVRISIATEIVYHPRDEVWAGWQDFRGKADARMPVFYSMRCSSTVVMRSGKVMMLAAHSPMDAVGKPDPSRKVMVFGRSDILRFGPRPAPVGPTAEASDDPFGDADLMVDPFANENMRSEPRDVDVPRVRLEFFEVSAAQYARLVAPVAAGVDDVAMRERVEEWVNAGEAGRLETTWMMGDRGGNTKAVREFIHPTDWTFGRVPHVVEIGNGAAPTPEQLTKLATAPFPTNWTTREVGSLSEPHGDELYAASDGTVDFPLNASLVRQTGFEEWATWQDTRGDNSVRMPVFLVMEVSSRLRALKDRCLLVAAVSGFDGNGNPDHSRKVLVFEKAEVLTVKRVPQPPKAPLLRTRVEFIEVSGDRAWEMVDRAGKTSDKEFRRTLLEMTDKGGARMLESTVVTCPSGMRAMAQNGSEYPHPQVYLEPAMPEKSSTGPDAPEPNGPSIVDWGTRQLGFTLEVEPTYDEISGWSSVVFTAARVNHSRDHVWYQWRAKSGNADVRMPEFEVLEVRRSVSLAPDEPIMVGTLTPFDPHGEPDRSRKVFVFVRCDPVHHWPWSPFRKQP